jgi:hypothetical protein
MDERIKIDDRLASFYDKLYADDSTVEACKGRVAEALAEMADSLRLGRMELTLDSPVSALRPSGAYQTNVLYDRKDGTVCEECFLRVYPVRITLHKTRSNVQIVAAASFSMPITFVQ